ncbi:MAG: ribosome maturation factor RimM, partial [Candidatus Zixiibacteriota bacterium]
MDCRKQWTQMQRIAIGQISRVHGIKGEMVVVPLTDDPERFSELERVFLLKDERVTEFEVERVRRHFKTKRREERVLFKLKGVE